MEYLIQLPTYEMSILGLLVFICILIFAINRWPTAIKALGAKRPFSPFYDVLMTAALVGVLFGIVIADVSMWEPPKHDETTATRLETSTTATVYEGWECILYSVDDRPKDIFRHCLPVSMKNQTTIQNKIKLYRVYNYNPSGIRWVPWIN